MKRRNKFSLSHFKLLTGKMGYLYPISCIETLPGDTFQMATSVFLRFSPMVAPVMTPVTVKIHHWFVPYRLVWDEFEDFITGGPDGMSVPVHPFLPVGAGFNGDGQLMDYFGFSSRKLSAGDLLKMNTLPIRAYNLIWNEWYRDQNLQNEVLNRTGSGSDWSDADLINFEVLRSPWDKDYFTTASPWEQKGAAINVPVNGLQSSTNLYANIEFSGRATTYGDWSEGDSSGVNGALIGSGNKLVGLHGGEITANVTTTGDIATSIGNINLNQFREAMAMQRFEEHRAMYGSRYVEYLRYLGVKASDARLQRPEYLGGGRSVIQFSEVLQTAEGTDPVGTMRGHGIGAMRTNRFRRFFEEHGVIISLLSIRPKSIYSQSAPRMFFREIKTDYWQKELEHIGQQAVTNKELYVPSSDPNGVFGYVDRYDEYRYIPSSVHGEFRELLNYWHLGRDFADQPVLNSDFISSLPSDRVFADQTGNDTIYMMVNNSVQARRQISRRGNPI